MRLRSIEVIQSGTRISSVDIFRAFAILPVVMYHFNGFLPYGYLGVDLFFVISGLLVGSILIRQFKRKEKISFPRFFLQRGFKIWPSYFAFLIVGSLLAYIFFRNSHPEYLIHGVKDAIRYVFFYQNYTAGPYHKDFDHVWSLCVEEHFYILLPLVFILIIWIFKHNSTILFMAVIGLIVTGIAFKIFSYHYMPTINTQTTTHNRIDALGWGVLLGLLVNYYEDRLRKIRWPFIFFMIGLLLFAGSIYLLITLKGDFFEKAIFLSLSPFCFFLMLLGLYYHDFSKWKPLRFIAYYSYNWYLWHPIFILITYKYFGKDLPGFIIYIVLSFLVAMLFTIFVEERFLRIRDRLLKRIFKPTTRAAA